MKITIEPDMPEEDEIQSKTYNNVTEFVLGGTSMEQKVLPRPFSYTHGDKYVLIGKIEEIKERIRNACSK